MLYNFKYLGCNTNWIDFTSIFDKLEIFIFLKLFNLVCLVYLGYLLKISIYGKLIKEIFVNLLIYVLQPTLMVISLNNIVKININLLYIPICVYIILCIYTFIIYFFLNILKIRDDLNLIFLSSTSLNFGYVGGSILVFLYSISDVISIINLFSIGSVCFLYTVGIYNSSNNKTFNVKLIFTLPLLYTLIIFILFRYFSILSTLEPIILKIFPLLSFLFLKVGIISLGLNFKPYKPKFLKVLQELWFKIIIFNKYIILPIFTILIIALLRKYNITHTVTKSQFDIIQALSFCPIAFNLIYINSFLYKEIDFYKLINSILLTLLISTILLITFLYFMV